ncbi:ABC transporter permease, partial [Clostridium polynesiense]|uniref:ABC transporter permease n=1 Tax=Clostridium polynesiense TaxID=1325933 RepID=UPI001FA7CDC3
MRNLKIFFREKSSVFFSLLGVFIIIGLYVLFLGDTFVRGMENVPGIRFLMDSWIMAGLLAVTSITTTMGAYGAMVDDKTSKRIKDFNAAPIKRYKIAGGYVLSSYIIGVIMSFLTFILAEIYIVSSGGELLSAVEMAQASGLILLNVLSSSAMIFFIVSFFNSNSAFSTASTVIGTLIGFLTGIYIPMGSLPESVQTVIKLFPVSHGGVLFR